MIAECSFCFYPFCRRVDKRRTVAALPGLRWLSARMRERWQEFKKSLRSIRVAIIIGPRGRRFPTEAVSQLGDPPEPI